MMTQHNSKASTDFTFIHLTDLHLSAGAEILVNDRSPAHKFTCLMERVQALEIEPAFVLITGDLVNDGHPDEYRFLQEQLFRLQQFGVPVLLGLGNHDARTPFRQIILGEVVSEPPLPYYYSTEINGLNVIVLDSHLPDEVSGYLDPEQLAWLDAELAKPMAHGHLIALHHPPVSATVRLLDTLGLKNQDELAAVVSRHTQVLGILADTFIIAMWRNLPIRFR